MAELTYDYLEKLKEIACNNCKALLAERYNDYHYETYNFYGRQINNLGVSEDIALWAVYGARGGRMSFYTDVEGKILFNRFFDWATLFCNGCALVSNNKKVVIIDINRHRLLSCPISFKDVRSIMDNQLSVLDWNKEKWGSYVINPETGIWTQDIPFIWDGLVLPRTKEHPVIAGLNEGYYYSDVDYNDPYCRMTPGYNKVYHATSFRAMLLSKEDAYNLDYFKDIRNKNSMSIVFDSLSKALEYFESSYFCNEGKIVETEDFKDYPLTLSKVISK